MPMYELSPSEQLAISSNFLNIVATPDGREKLAQVTESFIRTKLREVSFGWQILPPVQVDDTVLERSTEHDTLVKIEELEPDADAQVINFRGRPDTKYIRQNRIAIPIWPISTPKYEKDETELRASRSPLTKIVEENSLLELQRIIDDSFMSSANTAVTDSGMTYDDTVETALSTAFIKRVVKKLDNEERRAALLLLTKGLWDDVLAWGSEEAGTEWVSKKTQEGVKSGDQLGFRVITSIKKSIIKRNELWIFTEPNFLGRSFILENPKFWINKDFRTIQMIAYMDIGMALVNQLSLVRGKLTKIDAVTGYPI